MPMLPEAQPQTPTPETPARRPKLATVPRCPHCRYDQSGIVGMWRTACPLRGRCSECGGEFWWADLIGPLSRSHIRIFDATPHAGAYELGGTTLLAMLRPHRFWSLALRQGAPRRWRLLTALAFGPLFALGLVILAMVPVNILGAIVVMMLSTDLEAALYALVHPAWLPVAWDHYGDPMPFISPAAVLAGLVPILAGAGAFLFSASLMQTGIQRADWLRIWAWSFVWMPFMLLPWGIGGMVQLVAYESVLSANPWRNYNTARDLAFTIEVGRGIVLLIVAAALVFTWWRIALAAAGAGRPSWLAFIVTAVGSLLAICGGAFVGIFVILVRAF